MLKRLAELGLYFLVGCAAVALVYLLALEARAHLAVGFAFTAALLVIGACMSGWLALSHFRARRVTNLIVTACEAAVFTTMILEPTQWHGLVLLYSFAMIGPTCRKSTQPLAMAGLAIMGTLLILAARFVLFGDGVTDEVSLWTLRLAGFFILPMPLYNWWLSRADQQTEAAPQEESSS